jgi:hypothetical protein
MGDASAVISADVTGKNGRIGDLQEIAGEALAVFEGLLAAWTPAAGPSAPTA